MSESWNKAPSLVGKHLPLKVLIDDGTVFRTSGGNTYREVTVQCELCPEKTIFVARRNKVVSGAVISCPECSKKRVAESHITHGDSHRGRIAPELIAYRNMFIRCATDPDYVRGGIRIKVCARWGGRQASPQGYRNFLADMKRRPSKKHILHRIDNDGDYKQSNCIWADPRLSAASKRYAPNHRSRFRGVYQNGNIWAVKIAGLYMGPFATEEEAARAYDWKARQLWGDQFFYFNFKDGRGYGPEWKPPTCRPVRGSRVPSIVDKPYHHLTVLDDSFTHRWYGDRKTGQPSRTILVRCDCGTIKETNRQAVLDGRTKTCGRLCPFHQHKRGPNK